MAAKYNITGGTIADALAGTGVVATVVFVKSDGTRRAGMSVTLPTKDQEQIHWALGAMARQYDAGVATPVVPLFRVVLTVNTDISADAPTVP